MLGLAEVKGSTLPGADADLVILEDSHDADGFTTLSIREVWKFGTKVHGVDR
jgi:N-acetylglucosamine-6-phosphate deacetylase